MCNEKAQNNSLAVFFPLAPTYVWCLEFASLHRMSVSRVKVLSLHTSSKELPVNLFPAVVAGTRRVIRVERRIQELSDSITQSVEVQQRENNLFWTYLQRLENHLHQFTIYKEQLQQLSRFTAVAIELWCLNNRCFNGRKRGYSSRRRGTSRKGGRSSFRRIIGTTQ